MLITSCDINYREENLYDQQGFTTISAATGATSAPTCLSVCDAGYRGPACDFHECPSGSDPLDGYGNEAGRDCSGRGICNYADGTCSCLVVSTELHANIQPLPAK